MLMWPDKTAGSGDVIPTTLRIDKGREGVIRGDVALWFQHACCRFCDAAPAGANFDHNIKIPSPGRAAQTAAAADPLAE